MELEPFFYYVVSSKTPNLSNEKCILLLIIQYPTRKFIEGYMEPGYPSYARWEKQIMVILRISGVRTIFLLFYDHQDNEYK